MYVYKLFVNRLFTTYNCISCRSIVNQKTPKSISKLPIPGVENVIIVSSAKGGVGKSTVSVNLALALQNKLKNEPVGLMDADIFGPSIPKMLKLEGIQPEIDDKKRIIPLLSYQLKCMSIGCLVNPNKAVVWRGLMVMSAIQQLLRQVLWGPLHTLIIDMPPGTGDVQLSLCQNIKINGSVIVTTPQAVSTADTYRGISMLQTLKVPIYGIVENMSEFICPSCGHHQPLFDKSEQNEINRKSGGEKLSEMTNIPILTKIPIDSRLITAGDCGRPLMITHPESETAQIYNKLAHKIVACMIKT